MYKENEVSKNINSSIAARRKAQASFAGEAERLGLRDEHDVVAMVKEIRRERWEEAHRANQYQENEVPHAIHNDTLDHC